MDQMAIAQAMMAFQRQAAEHLAAAKADLSAKGLGFNAEDRAAIEESAGRHPYPAGQGPDSAPSPEDVARAQEVAKRALEAEYPPNGFPEGDPRVAPVHGVSFPVYAIAAKAIGWAPMDDPIVDRVVRALGLDRETYARAVDEWSRRVSDDVVVAAFYGQLFAQA